MSELPPILDAAQARDARFRTLDLGIEVEAALRAGRPLKILMDRLGADADEAMREFATTNPADTLRITDLQARVFRFTYTLETLNGILSAGRAAEQAVIAEDAAEDLAERERHD